MVSAFIRYGNSDIHFICFGEGSINIICLHGYGEGAESFNCLHECLPAGYCVIAFDLPFHGASQWREDRAFTISDMVSILNEIFKVLGRKDLNYFILGYSMGGRIALSLAEHYPQSISKLILLAPDGMTVNFWYWLATQTKTGNRLFRFTMNNPKWFQKLLQISNSFKVINKSVFKFIDTYINDENIRNQLFNRWTCMRTFKPNLIKIRLVIQQHKMPVRILYGRHDRIILSKRADSFRKGLESLCKVEVIDAGHQVLQKKYAGIIINLITS